MLMVGSLGLRPTHALPPPSNAAHIHSIMGHYSLTLFALSCESDLLVAVVPKKVLCVDCCFLSERYCGVFKSLQGVDLFPSLDDTVVVPQSLLCVLSFFLFLLSADNTVVVVESMLVLIAALPVNNTVVVPKSLLLC